MNSKEKLIWCLGVVETLKAFEGDREEEKYCVLHTVYNMIVDVLDELDASDRVPAPSMNETIHCNGLTESPIFHYPCSTTENQCCKGPQSWSEAMAKSYGEQNEET